MCVSVILNVRRSKVLNILPLDLYTNRLRTITILQMSHEAKVIVPNPLFFLQAFIAMRASALALGALGLAHANEELCYKVSYGDNFDKSAVLRPVSKYPEFHAKVTQEYCGGGLHLYDTPIPAGAAGKSASLFGGSPFWTAEQCLAASGGSSTACVDYPYSSCGGVGYLNAGSLFYAYNRPDSSSSNTGYEEAETIQFFFVQDDAAQRMARVHFGRQGRQQARRRQVAYHRGL